MSDKWVRAKFYQILCEQTDNGELDRQLQALAQQPYAGRSKTLSNGWVYRLESYSEHSVTGGTIKVGRIIRKQDTHFPGEYRENDSVANLTVRALSHEAVFIFDTRLSCICLETGQNRITASKLAEFLQTLGTGTAVHLTDMLTEQSLELLANGFTKKVGFKIARPENLSRIPANQYRSVPSNLAAISEAFSGDTIEAEITVGRGARGLDNALVRWVASLREPATRSQLGVKKLRLTVSDREDGSDPETINLLIETLQHGESLELEANNVEANHEIKRDFMLRAYRTHLQTIIAQRSAEHE